MEQIAQYADLIYAALLSAGPAIVSILGVVVACAKTLSAVKKAKKSFDDKTDVTELKAALNQCLRENAELKRTQRKLLAKLDKIDEKDVEEGNEHTI